MSGFAGTATRIAFSPTAPAPLGGPAAIGAASTVNRSDSVPDTSALAPVAHNHAIAPVPVNPAGASTQLNLNGADVAQFDVFLSVATCAITFTGWPVGKVAEAIVRVHQDNTGGRLITLPTMTWAEAFEATGDYRVVLKSAANAVTEFVEQTEDAGATLEGSSGQPVRIHRFTVDGALVSSTVGKIRDYFAHDARVCYYHMAVGDAPVSTAAVVDLNKNGVTMFTTQGNRPSVAAGANVNSSATLPDITTIAAGDYLTIDEDTASSAGNLVLDAVCIETA